MEIRYSKEFIKEWDPDYTKLTDEELKHLEKAEKSGFIDEKDIDWDNIGI